VIRRALAVALASLLQLSCVGPGIQKQADAVRVDIDKARKSGATKCAPRELALAETSVDFTETELAEGDFLRARQHVDVAVHNANAALALSKDCAPKRVMIKSSDSDNDTVVDRLDKCPLTPGPVENGGCPYGDKDGDGIVDNVDACVDVPEDKDGFEDDDGCPDLDHDKDGLLESVDKCPADPGPPVTGGCPDGDGDGFADRDDACPDVVGVSWEQNPEWKVKNPKGGNGCPPFLDLVVIRKDSIDIKQQVQFDTAKATIRPVSTKLLAEVATVIRASPGIEKVIISGHTDDVGDNDYNMMLSQDRANSVRQWLIDIEGIDAGLLEAIGFGEDKPIQSNRTRRGRQANRRSEFKVERKE
jgi:outer membrane protein OmpA-like peptidoglycan-associated protein